MDAPNSADYERIRRIRVSLHAELGRTTMTLAEVEQLTPGAVVTLHRLAGEPIELRCRGLCIARGEVVIEDDAFAVRVTEIVDPRTEAGRRSPRAKRK